MPFMCQKCWEIEKLERSKFVSLALCFSRKLNTKVEVKISEIDSRRVSAQCVMGLQNRGSEANKTLGDPARYKTVSTFPISCLYKKTSAPSSSKEQAQEVTN